MTEGGWQVIGAGPAGLAAAGELAGRGLAPVVYEQSGRVGGLAATVEHRGFRFDIGPHRFFTKNPEVERLWRGTLPSRDDFRRCPRLTRIHYRGRLFRYPLEPLDALRGLGPWTSARVLASFLRRQLFPRRPEASFGDWVTNRFGDVLFEIFFRTYTEKVWGRPCSELSVDWAAQRIRNLNLARAVLNALGLGRRGAVASLIDAFDYPRLGSGQMYSALADRVRKLGGRVETGAEVAGLRASGGRIAALVLRGADGAERQVPAGGVVSTMPLTELVLRLAPPAPPEVRAAAEGLGYRSIVVVNLIVRAAQVLPDNWVYLHAPEVRAARMQLFKNWSPAMVPDPAMSSLGLEYFAFEGDETWRRPDAELVSQAAADLARLGLGPAPEIVDGLVVRYPKAYPMYDPGYRGRLAIIRSYLAGFANLACAGRYGQFRYNNMDHAIVAGWLAARRLLGEAVDPWAVNEEAEYHEEERGPAAAPSAD